MCRGLTTRRSFGRTLSEHHLVQQKVAEGAAAIHAGNLMTLHCATLLEEGLDREARPSTSMAKNHVARRCAPSSG